MAAHIGVDRLDGVEPSRHQGGSLSTGWPASSERGWTGRLSLEVRVTFAIEVRNLRRTYGDVVAVEGVSFQVAEGEIFGLVGPNGAGKTTSIECLEGLRRPTSGRVLLLGMDPSEQRSEVAERIGVQLQESALPARLHVDEALRLFGSLYRQSVEVDELLDLMGLTEKRTTAFAKLSGGQKQRLFIALALVNRPEVVFFDELTTGLDPQARRSMWELVRQIRERGCTVVLTTHYMEEAERLCDRVMIMDRGRIVALDTPETLIASLGVDRRIVVSLAGGQSIGSLETLPTVHRIERSNGRVSIYGHGDGFVSSVVSALQDNQVSYTDLRTNQPNLEDVFLALTGKEMRE
jgi:ABC-2 type transport system ATP-binding protein